MNQNDAHHINLALNDMVENEELPKHFTGVFSGCWVEGGKVRKSLSDDFNIDTQIEFLTKKLKDSKLNILPDDKDYIQQELNQMIKNHSDLIKHQEEDKIRHAKWEKDYELKELKRQINVIDSHRPQKKEEIQRLEKTVIYWRDEAVNRGYKYSI